MDEDLIVREIVKSLAFEIEAVNQGNVLKWSTTNGTPLNVKVRVRNKDEPRLIQRDAIPMPRIGITAPEKLRLISSDQTILSFNVYLDNDLVKQEESKRRNGFKIFSIGGCLGTYSDDEGPYLPGSSNQNDLGRKSNSKSDSGILNEKVAQIMGTSNLVPRNQKGLFGKCKRGGCLDPPFNEDKYPYGIPKTNRHDILKLEVQDLEDKKQSHKPGGCLDPPFSEDKYPYVPIKADSQEKLELEIKEFEYYKLAHNISITSIDSAEKPHKESRELSTSIQKTMKDEVDPKRLMDIYAWTSKENSQASKYSHSIITYPTDISSTDTIYEQIPNKTKSLKSYDEESQKQSYNSSISYFVPPKNVLRCKEDDRRYSRELSDDTIKISSKIMISDTTDNTNLNQMKSTGYKRLSQTAKHSTDKDEVKLTLTKLQPNDINTYQNMSEEKLNDNATHTHPKPDYIEIVSYVQTDSTKIDDGKNIPVKKPKSNLRNTSRNYLSKDDVECLENTNNLMKTEDRLQSFSSHGMSPDLIFSTHNDKSGATQIGDQDNELLESQPNNVILSGFFPQYDSNPCNKDEKNHATTDSTKQSQVNIYLTQTADTETICKEPLIEIKSSYTEILNKLDTQEENKHLSQEKMKESNETKVTEAQNDIENVVVNTDQNKVCGQDIESTKQSILLPQQLGTSNSQLISNEDNSDNKTIQSIRPETVEALIPTSDKTSMIMSEKSSIKLKEKVNIVRNGETRDDIITPNKMHSESHSQVVQTVKGNQNEQRNLPHYHISSSENIEFDISSTNSMNSRQEHSIDSCTKNHVDTFGRRKQDDPAINLNAADIDEVIIQQDLLRDENIKITSNSSDKIINAILQKTLFITKYDSDIYNDEISKTIPLKRNTFTIIGSDNSLQKREEDEEITETLPDLCLKSTDKGNFDMLGHIYGKINILEAKNENLENKIHTDTKSGMESSLNNIQNNVSDMHLKTTNEPIPFDAPRNNIETLDKINKKQEHKVIADTGVNSSLTLRNVRNISISSNHNGLNADTRELESKITNSSINLRQPVLVNTNNNDDKNVTSFSPRSDKTNSFKDTSQKPILENIWDLDSKLIEGDKFTLYTQNYEKAKNLGTEKELEKTILDTSEDTSQKLKQEYLRNYYSEINEIGKLVASHPTTSNTQFFDTRNIQLKNNMQGSDVNLTPKSTTKNLHSDVTDSDNSFLITRKRDGADHLDTDDRELENIMHSKSAAADYTITSEIPLIGNMGHSKMTDDDNILLTTPINDKKELFGMYDGSGVDSSQKAGLENERHLYSGITDDGNYNPFTEKHFRPEILRKELKELEEITYSNADMHISQKNILKNENDLYFATTDYNKESLISNGIKLLDASYQQPENKMFMNLDVQGTEKLIPDDVQLLKPIMTDETSNKSEPFAAEHKELNTVIYGESATNSSPNSIPDTVRNLYPQIFDDNKYVSAVKTDDEIDILETDSIQPQPEVNAEKFEKNTLYISGHDSYSFKFVKPTNNSAELPFNLHTETTTFEKDYKAHGPVTVQDLARSEFKEKSAIISEALSNISENCEEERILTHEQEDCSGRDVNFSNLGTETDYKVSDSKPGNIRKELDSTITTMSTKSSDIDTKFSEGNHNVPRNTLVNTSLSTFRLGTDEDTYAKTITEALESMKYLAHSSNQIKQPFGDNLVAVTTSNIVSDGASLHNITDVADKHKEYKNNLVTNPSPNLSQMHWRRSEDRSSPHQQVILGKLNQIQTGVNKTNRGRRDSISTANYENPLCLDMSFYSYINDSNQRIIQTHIPLTEQQRRDDGTVTVIKSLIRHGNQIRIPVDKENDLALKILDKADICKKDSIVGSLTSHTRGGKHEVERTKKHNAVLNKNLALIYETELIPLHKVIKDLTQEVNTLTVKREMLQDRRRKVKRTKSLRLIPVKRCGCRKV